jgi:hypothetical protein
MDAARRQQANQNVDVGELADGPIAVAPHDDRRARHGADPALLLCGADQALGFRLAGLVAVRETLPNIELAFCNRTASLAADIGRAQV